MKQPTNHILSRRIQIETLSPISIGDGEVLSPYTDFIFNDNQDSIHLLDKTSIVKQIGEKEKVKGGLMKEYIDGIYSSFNNNRSEFNLKHFLVERMEMNTTNEAFRTIKQYGLREDRRREIKTMVKDNGQPYISGSTLKGGIKAALLYDWMLENKEGQAAFDKAMRELINVYDKCRRELEDIEYLARKARPSRDDKFEIRQLKKRIDQKGGRDLKRTFNRIIDGFLTKEPKNFPRDFNHLRVSDSTLMEEERTIFQAVKRLHYTKQINIPINLEAIEPESQAEFSLKIIPQFNHSGLDYLNSEKSLEELFHRINIFHRHNIGLELDYLDWSTQFENAKGEERRSFRNYQNFLEDLYLKIKNVLPNEAYMCIGFGKSFFYNSIGLLAYDWEGKQDDSQSDEIPVFQKYWQLFFLGNDGQKDFPLTRTVTNEGIPMGWVKIKF